MEGKLKKIEGEWVGGGGTFGNNGHRGLAPINFFYLRGGR